VSTFRRICCLRLQGRGEALREITGLSERENEGTELKAFDTQIHCFGGAAASVFRVEDKPYRK
jgi:hypothetical protein